MLNFQCESDNTKFNTPAPHSHLRPCNTNKSHDTREKMANWAQFGHFHSGVLTLVTSSLDLNGCVELFWGDSKFTLLYKLYFTLYSLLYIVAKCHFFSVVTWKDIIKYLSKYEGYTHFCEILYVLQYNKYILMFKYIYFNWLGRHCWECPQKQHIRFAVGENKTILINARRPC